jgi:tetratricopeptide (TPR) repeat protein
MTPARHANILNPVTGFLAELKRRRVLHMGGAYVAGAWLGAEILNFLLEQFQAPDWTYRFLAIVFVVGFPVAMVVAWIVQVQEDGSWAIDPARGDLKTLAAAIALGLLVTAGLSWLIVPERQPEPVYEPLANSLVVVPFEDHDDLYRSLMAGLEQSPSLILVRLREAGDASDPVAFGRDLEVASLAVVQPSRNGESKILELRLYDIVQGDVIGSQSFELETGNTIETSHAMANGLLEALALPPMTPEQYMGTEDVRAYERLIAGKYKAAHLNGTTLRTAIDEFERSIELDPGYARAYAGLAEAIYELLALGDVADEERSRLDSRARTAVDTAQKLDRTSADAISLLALGTANRQLRIQAFERALELDPDHYMSYYRYALQMKNDGNLDEAEKLIRRALLFCPSDTRFGAELENILQLRERE